MNSGFDECFDRVGDNRGPTGADCSKQVSVGHQTQPLVPGAIAGCEVPLDIVIGMELLLDPVDDQALHLLWFGAREMKHRDAVQYVLPFCEFRSKILWQMPKH